MCFTIRSLCVYEYHVVLNAVYSIFYSIYLSIYAHLYPLHTSVSAYTRLYPPYIHLTHIQVIRGLVCHKTDIQSLSVKVPRKEKNKFHEDLYPLSYYSGTPALTAEEWLAGESGVPVKVPISYDPTVQPIVASSVHSPRISVPTLSDTSTIQQLSPRSRSASGAGSGVGSQEGSPRNSMSQKLADLVARNALLAAPDQPSPSKASPRSPVVVETKQDDVVAALTESEEKTFVTATTPIATATATATPTAAPLPVVTTPVSIYKLPSKPTPTAAPPAATTSPASIYKLPSKSTPLSAPGSPSKSPQRFSSPPKVTPASELKPISLVPSAAASAITVELPVSQPPITATPAPLAIATTPTVIDESTDLKPSNESEEKVDKDPSSSSPTKPAAYGSVLRFRHIYGKEAPHKDHTYFNLRPNTVPQGPLLACSKYYWAVPYQGSGGGPVYVSRFDTYGKVDISPPLINGHKAPVTDLTFSPFHNGLLATAGGDNKVKIWQLPENPTNDSESSSPAIRNMTENDAIITLPIFNQTIKTLDFHPTVSGLVAVASQDLSIRMFDLAHSDREVTCTSLSTTSTSTTSTNNYNNSSNSVAGAAGSDSSSPMPNNLSFNHYGSLYALSCKDRLIRIIDPRSNQVVMTSASTYFKTSSLQHTKGIGRNFRLTWCHGSNDTDGLILTTSSSMSGMRLVHTWDPRSLSQPVSIHTVDSGTGQLFPLYDEGSGVCYVAGKGDTIIRIYELNKLKGINTTSNTTSTTSPTDLNTSSFSTSPASTCERASEYQTSREPIAGICLLPKSLCNIQGIEISRLLKLTTDSVIPISFHISRANNIKDYFQDDLYYPIRSITQPMYTNVENWLNTTYNNEKSRINQHEIGQNYDSLQPLNMLKLSEKPIEEVKKSKIDDFTSEIKRREEEENKRAEVFNRMCILANQTAQYNPNRSGGITVDAQRVTDDGDEEIDWDNEP